ncbi:transcriptional regulator, GntR family [Paenibacillus algicola]|uniref:Transcriptional regulator, GntR family n=1 Tax=Paenibacillus algicola TaxID=2565926 RepID=A0A4P8XQV7_9BACL|nr:GntR family transcriptional regulator [Paenibacillus sp. F411]QCT04913.1 transcriptional regulator, GntR family [Paenibacillus algicola]
MNVQYPVSWLQGASLGERISCELRLQIIKGVLSPGDVLSENRIAGHFGTSRSPVREAFRTLSAEGLITLKRMGAVVQGMSQKDVEELYDVRYLIESFVQSRMLMNGHTVWMDQLQHILDRMELAARHRDPVEFSFQDLAFHEMVVLEAKHQRMLHLWKSIRPIIMTVMLITTERIFQEGGTRLEAVLHKHRLLLDSLKSRDEVRLQAAVKEYFEDSRRTLHQSFPG